jgi:hypothetical protein
MESFMVGEADTMDMSKSESCASLPLLLADLAGDFVADRVLYIYYYY